MSGITSSTAELVKKAVWYMQKHPTLTTALAMQLAGFSEEDYANSSKQRMVRRHLPGKGKRKMKELLSSDSSGTLNGTTVPREVVVDCSPVTDPTTTDESFFTATEPESPPDKMNRCNSKQMQDKRRKELKRREKRKAAHKSGTTLYADQLSLGPDGMSVRQCAEINKKRNGGIGPSPSTLHHYVVKLGKIGTSPLKKGQEGILDPVVYNALCSAQAPEEWDAMCAARNLDMVADQVDNDANVGGDVGNDVGNKDREEEAV